MAIRQGDVDDLLVRCARHCCVCRRFRPLHLQVHHIVQPGDGGTDEPDNLIATCTLCHGDVHTKTALTRRFTVDELKRDREEVFRLVAEGKLPGPGESARIDLLAVELLEQLRAIAAGTAGTPTIPLDSLELLIAGACEESAIRLERKDGLLVLAIKSRMFFEQVGAADASRLLGPLLEKKLLYQTEVDIYEISEEGYALVDELVRVQARFTMKKVKCMACSLHFTLFTLEPERHTPMNIWCPECGQHDGAFMMWRQQEFGFIFQHVPGKAAPFAIGTVDLGGRRDHELDAE